VSNFKHLSKLEQHTHTLFEAFFHQILKHTKFSKFFKNKQHIQHLIQKQQESFSKTLTMQRDTLKKYAVELGRFHCNKKIPYRDLLYGVEVLQRSFVHQSLKVKPSIELIDEVFEYCEIIKSYGTKGYLKQLLKKDRSCLDSYIEYINRQPQYPNRNNTLQKIEWLKRLISHIEYNRLMQDKGIELMEYPNQTGQIDIFDDLKVYIHTTTDEILDDIRNEAYTHVLPLYQSLYRIVQSSLMIHSNLYEQMTEVSQGRVNHTAHQEFFEEVLEKEMEFQKRDPNYYFSLLYLDCDDYEHATQACGEAMGERIIKRLATIIETHIRTSDYGFRIDRDTFAIILKNAKRHIARKIAKKIATDFYDYRFITKYDDIVHMSISIGISEQSSSLDHQNVQQLQLIAKQNLQRAKSMGKNQIQL